MEKKEPEMNAPVELEDDVLDGVSGAGDTDEAPQIVPTYEPILWKK